MDPDPVGLKIYGYYGSGTLVVMKIISGNSPAKYGARFTQHCGSGFRWSSFRIGIQKSKHGPKFEKENNELKASSFMKSLLHRSKR
jgi:hypothetical protein